MYIYNATIRQSILFLCHPKTVDSEMLDKTLMTKQSFNQFCAWPLNEINLTLFMLQILVFISFRVKFNCIWCIQLYIIQYFASKWSRRNHRKCTNGLCHRVGLWTDISPCSHKYSSFDNIQGFWPVTLPPWHTHTQHNNATSTILNQKSGHSPSFELS